MASFVTTGTTVTQQTLLTAQTGVITVNGTLAVSTLADVDAVLMSGASQLSVLGTLSGWASAIRLNSATDMRLTVGTLGSVICADQALRGGYSGSVTIANAGLISATTAVALAATAANTTFVLNNSGTILANSAGTEAGIRITTATAASFAINNSGDILYSGTGDAIAFAGAKGAVDLANSGVISAAEGVAIASDGQMALRNTGTIIGDVVLGDVGDSVRNMGLITGDVYLHDGANTFWSVGGRVTGTVYGGADGDQYFIDRSDIRISDALGGNDSVYSWVSYRLTPGLELLNLEGTLGLMGIGSRGSNSLNGTEGDDTLRGIHGDDTIIGEEGDNLLVGGTGNDSLSASEGDDTMRGGAGNDTLLTGLGNDSLEGGDGRDIVLFDNTLPVSYMIINLTLGRVQVVAGEVISLSGIEDAQSGYGNDSLIGSAEANDLDGFSGNDTISAGGGNDTITGYTGADQMAGGSGADVFVFWNDTDSLTNEGDVITGFQANQDRIDLSLVDANKATQGTDDAFAFIGSAAFSGAAGQVRYVKDIVSNTTLIEVRLAGSALPDMLITLEGQLTLTAGAFVL